MTYFQDIYRTNHQNYGEKQNSAWDKPRQTLHRCFDVHFQCHTLPKVASIQLASIEKQERKKPKPLQSLALVCGIPFSSHANLACGAQPLTSLAAVAEPAKTYNSYYMTLYTLLPRTDWPTKQSTEPRSSGTNCYRDQLRRLLCCSSQVATFQLVSEIVLLGLSNAHTSCRPQTEWGDSRPPYQQSRKFCQVSSPSQINIWVCTTPLLQARKR